MAVKADTGKPRLGLFPTHAIFAAGRALTYGADGGKYGDYNYKTDSPNNPPLDWNRYYDALLRHLFAWIGGEENDPESKLSHIDHVVACSAMLADAVNSGIGKDTRFVKVPVITETPEERKAYWKKVYDETEFKPWEFGQRT